MTIAQAAADLLTALKTVGQTTATAELGAALQCPALVLGAPALQWEAYNTAPTSGRWVVYAVVDVSERAMEQLWELVPRVAAALDELPNVAVLRADPGTWAVGTELPCYEIQIDVSL